MSDSDNAAHEDGRRRRARSLAIAWALGGIVVLFFVMTLVRLGANMAE